MKIAINARLLLPHRKDGITRFSDEVLKRITRQHPEHDFLFLFDRKYDNRFIYADNIDAKVVYPQARHPILYDIWFNYRLPGILKRERADVFVSTDGYLPLNCRIPTVAVIHDLNFEHHPELLPTKVLRYYKKRFPVFAEQAAHICTVSQFSKKDIIETYGIDSEKISVVYNGISSSFRKLGSEQIHRIQREFTDGKPYFIFTGSLHARKNIARMLEGFSLFKKRNNTSHKLVLAGERKWWSSQMNKALESGGYKDDVIFVGLLPEEKFIEVVASAQGMIYIPIFEGFGIPPLEAMQSGVPVLASDIEVISEISGPASHLVNPYNIEEIAEGIHAITQDKLRKQLITKGNELIKKYSWQQTSESLWAAIEGVL